MPLEYEIKTYAVPGNTPLIIAGRNASRRYLIVSNAFTTSAYVIWPQQQTFGPGIGVPDGQGYILIHRNVLADLITYDWYCYAPIAVSVTVLDAWDA